MRYKKQFRSLFRWFFYSEGKYAHYLRRLFLLIIDIFIILFSMRISFWLGSFELSNEGYLIFSRTNIAILLIGVTIYSITGQYKGLTKYQGSKAFYYILVRTFIIILFAFSLKDLIGLNIPENKDYLLIFLILFGLISLAKFGLRDILLIIGDKKKQSKKRVAIYGAGSAGAQLEATLRLAKSHKVEFFIDDNPILWKRTLNGILILPSASIKDQIKNIDQILFAIPSLNRFERNLILETIENHGIPILQIPSIDELTSQEAKIDSLRPIEIEDLLGREEVTPDNQMLEKAVMNSVVCVTGAGGSIAGEICRQIIRLNAKTLLLFEQNEPSLYSIYEELKKYKNTSLKIVPILGNILDTNYFHKILLDYNVNIIFHAAAYKHVPMVENNALKGIENNVFGTQSLCKASINTNVEKFIFISSDKAVRPTNIMGASKRLAELVVLNSSEKPIPVKDNPTKNICFSMVRFGNVLGSSGSVVPLFKKQIKKGGPITLTHNDVVRYFMTIPEASQLVIQASFLTEGGELFLLDMGDPILIRDLAKKMINLAGLKVKDKNNPNGDIEIITTGLRKGEKLYEELLINSKSQKTIHKLIYRANEPNIQKDKLNNLMSVLELAIRGNDLEKALNTLHKLVPEWIEN